MRYTLKDYQVDAVADVLRHLHRARDNYQRYEALSQFALAATTGAGKSRSSKANSPCKEATKPCCILCNTAWPVSFNGLATMMAYSPVAASRVTPSRTGVNPRASQNVSSPASAPKVAPYSATPCSAALAISAANSLRPSPSRRRSG